MAEKMSQFEMIVKLVRLSEETVPRRQRAEHLLAADRALYWHQGGCQHRRHVGIYPENPPGFVRVFCRECGKEWRG